MTAAPSTMPSQPDDKLKGIDYTKTGFMLKEPGSLSLIKGPVLLAGRHQHKEMVDYARKHKLYVWYGAVVRDGRKASVVGQHLVDWDSVPDEPYGPKISKPKTGKSPKLRCSVCGKKCSSTSGLTLHLKKHD